MCLSMFKYLDMLKYVIDKHVLSIKMRTIDVKICSNETFKFWNKNFQKI